MFYLKCLGQSLIPESFLRRDLLDGCLSQDILQGDICCTEVLSSL